MAGRDYLQHGRRHSPGGTDPIPGLGNANFPWGYARHGIFTFPSSSVPSHVDFNPSADTGGFGSGRNFGGRTSGDSAITFGDDGSGRYALLIEETGFYLVGTGVRCFVTSSPATGSGCYLDPDWRDKNIPIGDYPIQPFVQQPGGSRWIADISTTWPLVVDGTVETVPHTANTAVAQNSGVNAVLEVYQFAVKVGTV